MRESGIEQPEARGKVGPILIRNDTPRRRSFSRKPTGRSSFRSGTIRRMGGGCSGAATTTEGGGKVSQRHACTPRNAAWYEDGRPNPLDRHWCRRGPPGDSRHGRHCCSAKKQPSPKEIAQVTGLIVMTPNGPATCSRWIAWRQPTADPVDTAAIEHRAEDYLSGLAAGSHHEVIGAFRHDALAAWRTQYWTANPRTPLPEAIVAHRLVIRAHPDSQL